MRILRRVRRLLRQRVFLGYGLPLLASAPPLYIRLGGECAKGAIVDILSDAHDQCKGLPRANHSESCSCALIVL